MTWEAWFTLAVVVGILVVAAFVLAIVAFVQFVAMK